MGTVYAEITVKNEFDVECARVGHIKENEVRSVTLNAVVDTGATTLVISEEVFRQLGLAVVRPRTINTAGGGTMQGKITSSVHIYCENRFASTYAVVLPAGQTLLGVVPLELMDLMVDPVHQKLVGVNGDEPQLMAM